MSSSKRQRVKEEDPSDEVIELQPLVNREPEHFLLKVESFSVLSKSKMKRYESDEFKAGGYKWRLILYPNGDKKRNVQNHISLNLSISDTKSLPQGWEVKAHFTLFVYNNIADKYLPSQVSTRRFHGLKMEWGFAKLLKLDYFKESSNGYLFDDTCVFGAEVSVISTSVGDKRQCLSMIKETDNKIFSWKLNQFSTIKDEYIFSGIFEIGELQWKLRLYPKGHGDGEGTHISLFLEVATLSANWKVYAEYKLRLKNQVNGKYDEGKGIHSPLPIIYTYGISLQFDSRK